MNDSARDEVSDHHTDEDASINDERIKVEQSGVGIDVEYLQDSLEQLQEVEAALSGDSSE